VRLPATAKWVLLALVGLAIAIGVAIAAANLTRQQIGIASESASAGDTLAPALHVPAKKGHPGEHGGKEAPPAEEPTPVPVEPPPSSAEEIPPPEGAAPTEEAAESPSEGGGERERSSGGGDGDD
jgi:hypothetical protein